MVDNPALLIVFHRPELTDSFRSLSLLQSLLVTRAKLTLCLHIQREILLIPAPYFALLLTTLLRALQSLVTFAPPSSRNQLLLRRF